MATVYRVENQLTMIGLWYNAEGEKVDFIKTFGGKAQDLPMEFDPSFVGGWFSGCDSLPQMRTWFSPEDLSTLGQGGYELFEIEVPEYRAVPSHILFRREGAVFTPVPIALLDIEA